MPVHRHHCQPTLPVLPCATFLLPALFPWLAPASAQVSPCAKESGACCCLPQQGAGILPSSLSQGEFFKPSLIRKTIGGWKEGRERSWTASRSVKTAAEHLKNFMEVEREGGKDRQVVDPLCCSVTHSLLPSKSGCVGTVEEQRADYKFGLVSLCSMSGKLIALGLSFLL